MRTKTAPAEETTLWVNSITFTSLEPRANGAMKGTCKLDGGYCVNDDWLNPLNRPVRGIPLVSATVPVMDWVHALAVACGKTNAEMVAAFGVATETVLTEQGQILPAPPKV